MNLDSLLVTILEKVRGRGVCDDCLGGEIENEQPVAVPRMHVSASAYHLDATGYLYRDIGICMTYSMVRFINQG